VPLFDVNQVNTPQITKLVNNVKPTTFDRISAPANNVAARVAENKQSVFSANATGSQAVLNSIQASSLTSNSAGQQLFLSLLESNISHGNNLRSIVKRGNYNEDAARFNPETSKTQLFRLELRDINASVSFPTQQLQNKAFKENALELTRPTDDRFASFALA